MTYIPRSAEPPSPSVKLHRIREEIALGEVFRCPACDRRLGRRTLPWVASWSMDLPQTLSASLLAANRHGIDGDVLDFGTTVPGCEAVREAVLASASAALREICHRDVPFSTNGYIDVMVASHAGYHCDAGFGHPVNLFLVVSTSFQGDLVFPNADVRVSFGPGTAVLFDPIQPHGLCEPGASVAGGVPACCLSVDLSFGVTEAARLGMAWDPTQDVVDAAGIRVDWEDGNLSELYALAVTNNASSSCSACTALAGDSPNR